MPPAIEVKDLTVSFGKNHAVQNLSLSIPAGSAFGFIGPNGAGKSTTMRVLATLQKPTAGSAYICGHHVQADSKKARMNIGYMPDAYGKYDMLTVQEYLRFFAAIYQIKMDLWDNLIRDVLELTDLNHKLTARVDALSRGMKQRLAVARILLHDPAVLLMDEPASGLDPRARIEFREILKTLVGMGKTVMISSHILHELGDLCDRIGIMEAGRLVAEGTLSEIYSRLEMRRIVHVRCTTEPPGLMDWPQKFAGCISVERERDRLVFQVNEDVLSPEDLLSSLIDAGGRIRMFQPEAMDMETVFMKLTTGKTA